MRGEPASFNNSLRKSRLYDIIMKRVDLVSVKQSRGQWIFVKLMVLRYLTIFVKSRKWFLRTCAE